MNFKCRKIFEKSDKGSALQKKVERGHILNGLIYFAVILDRNLINGNHFHSVIS